MVKCITSLSHLLLPLLPLLVLVLGRLGVAGVAGVASVVCRWCWMLLLLGRGHRYSLRSFTWARGAGPLPNAAPRVPPVGAPQYGASALVVAVLGWAGAGAGRLSRRQGRLGRRRRRCRDGGRLHRRRSQSGLPWRPYRSYPEVQTLRRTRVPAPVTRAWQTLLVMSSNALPNVDA
jgi:hypothetical protein